MRPRIKHIALVAKDVAQMAEFYKNAFGMHEVHRHWTNEAKGRYTIYLSDGEINLAIFAPNELNGREEGIYHFGFQVDDVEQGYQQALGAGAKPPFRATAGSTRRSSSIRSVRRSISRAAGRPRSTTRTSPTRPSARSSAST